MPMKRPGFISDDTWGFRMRKVGFVVLGVAVLVFKRHYSGPFEAGIHAYAANVAVSFAVYFNVLLVPVQVRYKQLWAAGFALAAVELFEVFDGFGIMTNVYDSLDLVANAVGVFLALVVDTALAFPQLKRSGRFTRITYVPPDATKKKYSN
jgi:hypothetical protein